ncbi:MAG: hypothetical protein EBX40_04675 [Gammaproteobacteria bacterium]|nr:hypothetical protein [Gammaproteobacteria bacterium]
MKSLKKIFIKGFALLVLLGTHIAAIAANPGTFSMQTTVISNLTLDLNGQTNPQVTFPPISYSNKWNSDAVTFSNVKAYTTAANTPIYVTMSATPTPDSVGSNPYIQMVNPPQGATSDQIRIYYQVTFYACYPNQTVQPVLNLTYLTPAMIPAIDSTPNACVGAAGGNMGQIIFTRLAIPDPKTLPNAGSYTGTLTLTLSFT